MAAWKRFARMPEGLQRLAAWRPRVAVSHGERQPPESQPSQQGSPRLSLWPPPPFAIALGVVAVAVAFVAALSWYGADRFTSNAAEARASEEAASFASHSATLATGDAFGGYLQILRYADDPVLRNPRATADQRNAAMQQLLYLNTNRLQSLALADRAGILLAATDPSIGDVRRSEAFNSSRADLGPANSDIILPAAGEPGYVEFTAPVRDASGAVWAILYGRADPDRLWAQTLLASIEGGRNVIINNQGQFSAGVPSQLLRAPWSGRTLDNGSVRADIAGVDSICGLGAIGKDTRIDHGWNVASCVPASLIQTEASRAMGKQGLVTAAAAVFAVCIAALVLRAWLRVPPAPQDATVPAAVANDLDADGWEPAAIFEADNVPPDDDAASAIELPAASEPQPPAIVADVDALALIAAYEERVARVAERIRAEIEARMLIASTEAAEAFRIAASAEQPAANAMHARAVAELEDVREHALRALRLELHPAVVRLGLPGALRALRGELEGRFALILDVDPASDSVGGDPRRPSLTPSLRLAIFRVVQHAVEAAEAAEAERADVTLRREDGNVRLRVEVRTSLRAGFEADALTLQAYGGTLEIERDEGGFVLDASVPAPAASAPAPAWPADPADWAPASVDDAAPPRVIRINYAPEPADDVTDADEPDDDMSEGADPATSDGVSMPDIAIEAGDDVTAA